MRVYKTTYKDRDGEEQKSAIENRQSEIVTVIFEQESS